MVSVQRYICHEKDKARQNRIPFSFSFQSLTPSSVSTSQLIHSSCLFLLQPHTSLTHSLTYLLCSCLTLSACQQTRPHYPHSSPKHQLTNVRFHPLPPSPIPHHLPLLKAFFFLLTLLSLPRRSFFRSLSLVLSKKKTVGQTPYHLPSTLLT
jgi:hypothetical protein